MFFLIIVLIAAALLSGFLGNWGDTLTIGLILVVDQTMDAFYRWKVRTIAVSANKFAGHDVRELDVATKIHSSYCAHKIVQRIMIFLAGAIVLTLVFFWYRHALSYDLVLGLMAFLVAVVPESLPLAITILLLRRAADLAHRGLVVRRLHAIEQFGTAHVLLLDAHSRIQCCDAPGIAASAAGLNMRVIVEPDKIVENERVIAVTDRPISANVVVAWGASGVDCMLTSESCGVLEYAIISGRQTCVAIRRVILYLFSCNLAEAAIVLLALFCGLALPLTGVQLLWVNVLTDGLMDMALVHERDDWQDRKQVHIMTFNLLAHIVILASVQVLACLVIFYLYMSHGLAYARTMVLLTIISSQWFNAWNCRSERMNVFKLNICANYWLIIETSVLVILQTLVFAIAPMRTLLGLVPLEFTDALVGIVAASSVLFIGQLYVFFKNYRLQW